jgi:hypothetical protein
VTITGVFTDREFPGSPAAGLSWPGMFGLILSSCEAGAGPGSLILKPEESVTKKYGA